METDAEEAVEIVGPAVDLAAADGADLDGNIRRSGNDSRIAPTKADQKSDLEQKKAAQAAFFMHCVSGRSKGPARRRFLWARVGLI